MVRSGSLPDGLEQLQSAYKAVNVKEEQLSSFLRLRTSDLVVDKGHPLVASALQGASGASAGVAVGFVYEVSVGQGRDVTFHIDVTGSENLRMSQAFGGGMLRKTDIAAGSPHVQVAVVEVCDVSKPWSLQCRYSWTEKEASEKQVAPGLVLKTTDMWTKGRAVTAIGFDLTVSDSKRVVFDLDFQGSENLELATGGLKLRTVVDPSAGPTSVGYLQVVDPAKPWSLKSKYSWKEDQPARPVVGNPERKDLAPGLALITTRTEVNNGEAFRYQLACSKNSVVDFTLDCSESVNMALRDGEAVKRTVVQPWERTEIGTVCVVRPAKPWSLKVKLGWVERPPPAPKFSTDNDASVTNLVEQFAYIDFNPAPSVVTTSASSSATMTSSSSSSSSSSSQELPSRTSTQTFQTMAAPPPARAPPAPSSLPARKAPGLKLDLETSNAEPEINLNPSPIRAIPPSAKGLGASRPSGEASGPSIKPFQLHAPPPEEQDTAGESTLETKEISPGVFLTTNQIPGETSQVKYTLDIKRPCVVTFKADFTGSINLNLEEPDASNPLVKKTTAQPFKKTVVARLRVGDPHKPWNLRCKYEFEEQDALISPLAGAGARRPSATAKEPNPPPPGVALRTTASTSSSSKLGEFLQGIGLQEHIQAFESEQVDWELLLAMAQNEDSLRSTLKELGVTRLGNRERIITSLRQYCKN